MSRQESQALLWI